MAKTKKIFLWVILTILAVALISFVYLKLKANNPQYIENNALTVQTPEETHRKFVDALKKEDFDEAVRCCIVEEEQKNVKEFLDEVIGAGKLSEMIDDLSRNFAKESMDSNKAHYSFSSLKDEENYGHIITFIKETNGVWLIESL